jgi:hypothetical protein
VWTYTFTEPLANPPAVASPLCVNTTDVPPAPAGTAVSGPFDFDLSDGGWTASSSNPALNLWKRAAPGDGSALSWQTIPYNGAATGSVTTSVVSPKLDWTGGWLYVDFADRLDTEPGFDVMFVDWSCDGGGTWSTVPWVWDKASGGWSGSHAFTGQNPAFPLFDQDRAAFKAPAGPVNLRFRFVADDLVGTPPYTGAAFDNVTIKR